MPQRYGALNCKIKAVSEKNIVVIRFVSNGAVSKVSIDTVELVICQPAKN